MTFPSFSSISPASLPALRPLSTLPPGPVASQPAVAMRLPAANHSFASPMQAVAHWRQVQVPAGEVHRAVERFLYLHPEKNGFTARQIFKGISQERPDIPLKRVHNACHNLADRDWLRKTPATDARPAMGFRLTGSRRNTLRGTCATSRATDPAASRKALFDGWSGYLRSCGIDDTATSSSEVVMAFLKSRAVARHDRCSGMADLSAEYLTGFLAVQKHDSAIVCLYGRPSYLQAWRDAQGVWLAQPLPTEEGAVVTTLESALTQHLRAFREEADSQGQSAVHVVAFDAH